MQQDVPLLAFPDFYKLCEMLITTHAKKKVTLSTLSLEEFYSIRISKFHVDRSIELLLSHLYRFSEES